MAIHLTETSESLRSLGQVMAFITAFSTVDIVIVSKLRPCNVSC